MHYKLRTHAPLLGLAALVSHPAYAQTLWLSNGDNVTVSGTGTAGTVNNPNTSYSDSLTIPYAVMVGGNAIFTLGAGGTLTATAHGAVSLDAFGSGSITINGGTINGAGTSPGLLCAGSGPLTVSGGTINGALGGSALSAYSSAPATISGGAITAAASSTGLDAQGTGPVTVIGGTFIAGPHGTALYASGNGTINLFSQGGSTFYVNGVAMNNTSLPHGTRGTISGILLDGEALNTTYTSYGIINLNVGNPPVLPTAVPEPSSVAAFAFTGLGLAALTLRARKRKALA